MTGITQVFKTGEKVMGAWSSRGPKPQGYNVYIRGIFILFIPYDLSKKGVK